MSALKMCFYHILFYFLFISVIGKKCEGLPLNDTAIIDTGNEKISGDLKSGEENSSGGGGILSSKNPLQSGVSTLLNMSNMKDSKLVMGGFSLVIIPSPDFGKLGQLNPGMLTQLFSQIGRK